jgi:hypothetical protein
MATRKPTPKPLPRQARRQAPLDLVRNPNFDAAMAQQNYDNFIAEQRARMAAQQGQFTQGSLMGAPEMQSQQAFQDEIARRNTLLGYNNQTYGSYVNQPAQQGFGDIAGTMSSAGQLPSQQQFDPNARSLMPIQTGGSMIGSIGDQRNIYNNLQPYVSQVGSVPMPRPEQQMQNYQNFLQQGMQNSNTLNQGAMASFANTQPGMQVPQVPQAGAQVQQPGMQVPQAGIGQPNNPNMAGMATQQRRQNPAPRKFSTVSNTPARFA